MNASVTHHVSAIQAALDARRTAASARFWNAYMKGAVSFRGVPLPAIRDAVAHHHRAELGATPPEVRRGVAWALLAEPLGDDKLAGVSLLASHLLDELTLADLTHLEAAFEAGHLADWNTVDWLCVKVLAPWIRRGLPNPSRAIAVSRWAHASTLWQRRASNVAFVPLAKLGNENFPGFVELMFGTAGITVQCSDRFAQTGVGWLLRELSLADRVRVFAFLKAHAADLTREGMRYAIEKLPPQDAARLLAHQDEARAEDRSPTRTSSRTPRRRSRQGAAKPSRK